MVKKGGVKIREFQHSLPVTLLTCYLGSLLFLASIGLKGNTYRVTNINDTGPGSLRAALDSVNNNFGNDTITFNILGVGVQTISPQSQLPPLIDRAGVFIDGFTQGGASPGGNPPSSCTLMVEINGAAAGASHGFWILSPNNKIQGLVINNFEQDGIRIQGTQEGDGTFNNYIYSNFIGTVPTGTLVLPNGWNKLSPWAGVHIVVTRDLTGFAYDNIVHANLISGNYAEGVGISSCPPGDVYLNVVLENYIGTDVTGMFDFGNEHDGVYIGEGAHDNTVDSNLISGNDYEGVCIIGYVDDYTEIYTHHNYVLNNTIGLAVDLVSYLGNNREGVSIGKYGPTWQLGYAIDNMIGPDNIIAYNGRSGVMVFEHPNNNSNADGNQITQNSIYDNGLVDPGFLGIDLGDNGVTLNDLGDPDIGPNEELNFPVITSTSYSSGQTTIRGTVNIDTDPKLSVVEVFKAKPDPTNYGEGETYLDSTNPDASGNWNVVVSGLNIGDSITATTTDMNLNTSEFCENVSVKAAGVEDRTGGKPHRYELNQNQPNPFNSSTAIQYAIPKTTHVSLKIYDISGRLVRVLVDGLHKASYSTTYWDGRDEMGRKVSPGIYFYHLETGDFKDTKKLILIR